MKAVAEGWCATCRWSLLEEHPREPYVLRCTNCKEWIVILRDGASVVGSDDG